MSIVEFAELIAYNYSEEPLDADYLRNVGFKESMPGILMLSNVNYSLSVRGDEWWINTSLMGVKVPSLSTKGQLRQLCAVFALGLDE